MTRLSLLAENGISAHWSSNYWHTGCIMSMNWVSQRCPFIIFGARQKAPLSAADFRNSITKGRFRSNWLADSCRCVNPIRSGTADFREKHWCFDG